VSFQWPLVTSALPAYGPLSSIYTTALNRQLQLCSWPTIHPFGLIVTLHLLWEHGIFFLFITVPGFLLLAVFLSRRGQSYQDAPATFPHFPLSHVTSFLKQRHDFFAWGFKVTNQRLFRFKLLRVCWTFVALMASAFH